MILSHPVQEVVKQAIAQTNSSNRYDLCLEIANILEQRYEGKKLEYQSKRMYLGSTKQILEVIDSFFFCYLKLPNLEDQEKNLYLEEDSDFDALDFLNHEDLFDDFLDWNGGIVWTKKPSLSIIPYLNENSNYCFHYTIIDA